MTEPAKMLVLIDWFPPAVKAGGIATSVAATVKQMSDRFDISVLCRDKDLGDTQVLNGITSDEWISREGYRVKYLSDGQLKHGVRQELQAYYDVIYINSLWSIPFTIRPLSHFDHNFKKKHLVVAPHGMFGRGALNQKKLKKKIFMAYAKWKGLYASIRWHASSEFEEEEIRAVFGKKADVSCVENLPGVELISEIQRDKIPGELKLIFISRIHPIKNLLFLLENLAMLEQNTVSLDVFGPVEDEKYWQKCQDFIASKKLNVNYHGSLKPDEVVSTFADYHLFALPTLTENYGNVVLEAMNASCPVLVSDQTPWVNLKEQHAGLELSLNDSSEWVEAIRMFYDMDQKQYTRWSNGAWQLGKKKIEDKELKNKYFRMFTERLQ
jgi:glycosyltransferase involved in cell wall biosynthesis